MFEVAYISLYKVGFALVKQPVLWQDLESDQNIIIWDILPIGVIQDSPFLTLENANVLIQSFNQDVFRFSDRLYNYLGTKVDVKLTNENDMSGTLVEITDETLTLIVLEDTTLDIGFLLPSAVVTAMNLSLIHI